MASGEGSKAVDFDEILLQPSKYLEQAPGKSFNTPLLKLTKAFNFWLNIALQKCVEIGKIMKMVNIASNLIDDIEDNSKLRKGIPAAHHIFGVPSTINSANYVYFSCLLKLSKLGHPEATRVFTEQLLEFHRGQGMEIYWRDSFLCPTEEEYKEMAKKQAGALFGLFVKFMQLFSDNKSDFSEIVDIIGIYTQIREDYANLKFIEETEGKGFCDDLTEGKFSFPVIHSIRSNLDDPRLMNIIRQRTTDVEIKKYALGIMEEMGSFEYCRKVLMDLDSQERREIERLGHNEVFLSLLDDYKV